MASQWQSSQMKKKEQWSNHVRGHIEVEVSEDLTESEAVIPGLTYGDLDRTGDAEPWRIFMLVQTGEDNVIARGVKQTGRDSCGFQQLFSEGKLAFTISTKLDILPEVYTRKDDFLYEKVLFRQFLNKVGNTSLEMVKELHCMKGYPLVRVGQSIVVVDKDSHSPAEHPKDYMQRFGKVKPKVILERFIKTEKPSSAFHTTYRVTWSDTDYYYHSNQTSYLRFAVNAAAEACFSGYFSMFPRGDLAHHKIHCMTMLYAAETRPGDNLDLFVWEDPLVRRRIHVQIEKDAHLVYVTSIDFFEGHVVGQQEEKGAKESKM